MFLRDVLSMPAKKWRGKKWRRGVEQIANEEDERSVLMEMNEGANVHQHT